jgi:hypothetical protein
VIELAGAGERVVPMAIFICTFFAISVLMIAGFNEMLTRAEQNKGTEVPSSSETLVAADLMLDLYSPVGQQACATSLAGTNKYQVLSSFTMTGQTTIHCMIARNWSKNFFNTFGASSWGGTHPLDPSIILSRSSKHDNPGFVAQDFLLFWQTWMGGTLALERRYRYDFVTFPELVTVHDVLARTLDSAFNLSVVNVHCRYWVTTLTQWFRDPSFGGYQDYHLWANQFNVSVSTGFNATYGSISPGTVITQLIGLKIPGVPMWIQAMIMIPVAVTVLLIIVMVVSYFWI